MSHWSEPLPEILQTIAGKLELYEDYISFLCVCTSWRSSATTTTKHLIHHLPSRYPMLMLAESNTNEDHNHHQHHQHRRFFLLSNGGTIRTLPLPEAHRQRCVSTHGWLLTTGEEEFCAKLVHPLSHTQIDLPQLYMFDDLCFEQNEWIYYGFCLRKVVFTSSNPLSQDPSFRVIIIWGSTIGFCRPGDASWGRIDGWEGLLFDIAYHSTRKRLYVVATMGAIYECNIVKDVLCPITLSKVTTFPREEFGCFSFQWAYLLEWADNSLLMITRERDYFKKHDDGYGRYGPYRTSRFECFVYALDDGKWSKITSLGDRAVFVGFNSSFAITGGECVKQNCIYFTDDLYEPYRGLPEGGGADVGVYDMLNDRIESIFESQASVLRCSLPLWLQSSLSMY